MKDMLSYELQQAQAASKAATEDGMPGKAGEIMRQFAITHNAVRDRVVASTEDLSVEALAIERDPWRAIGAINVALTMKWPGQLDQIKDRIDLLDTHTLPGDNASNQNTMARVEFARERAQLVDQREKLVEQEKYLRKLLQSRRALLGIKD